MKQPFTKTIFAAIFFVLFYSSAFSQLRKEMTKDEIQTKLLNERQTFFDEITKKTSEGTTLVKIQGVVFFDVNQDSVYNIFDNGFRDEELVLYKDCGSTSVVTTLITDGIGFFYTYIDSPGEYELILRPNINPNFEKVTKTSFCFTIEEGDNKDYVFNIGFTNKFCDENKQAGGICETAPFFCNLKYIETFCSGLPTMEGPLSGTSFCPDGGVFNNSSWFQFVAGEGDYSFAITPFDCAPGGGGSLGMQAAIFPSCDDLSNPIVCNSNLNTELFTVPTSKLTPGNIYYFVLDGVAGSICNYTITIEGDYIPFNLSTNFVYDLELKEQPPVRCQNDPLLSIVLDYKEFTDSFSLSVFDNFEYSWIVTSPFKKGGFPLQNYFTYYGNTFEYIMNEVGDYEVCLHKISAICTEIVTVTCKKFTLSNDLPKLNLGMIELNSSSFPWTGDTPDLNGLLPTDTYGNTWQGSPINKTDINSFPQTFTNIVEEIYPKCSYIQSLEIRAFFNEIGIYPNPTADILTLTIDHPSQINSYKIINHLGKVQILSPSIDGNLSQLDISALKPGLYYMQFLTSTGTIIKSFTKGL